MKILIINGPNLDMLKYRNPEIYGTDTFEMLENKINEISKSRQDKIEMVFTNYEGKYIDYIHQAVKGVYDALIVNPAAFTHYSYAIADALEMFEGIKVEVHLSDINNREEFRKTSVITNVVTKTISGKGMEGYIEAIEYIQS